MKTNRNIVMNIYHVERTDGGGGYDTYSDFVIVAKSEQEARSFRPHYDGTLQPIDSNKSDYGEWVTFNETEATLIGEAKGDYTEPTLICASYHAG